MAKHKQQNGKPSRKASIGNDRHGKTDGKASGHDYQAIGKKGKRRTENPHGFQSRPHTVGKKFWRQ